MTPSEHETPERPAPDAPRLSGVRVCVTRPKGRAETLCFLLEDEGAEVTALPLLELLPPDDPRPLRAAAEQLHRWAWIALTSPSGVEALREAVREAGTLEHLAKAKLAVVGPKTARAVEALGLVPALVARQATGGGLAESLLSAASPDDEVLIAAAQEGRTDLFETLREHGLRVSRVAAYRSVASPISEEGWALLRERPPDAVLFGSPRTAQAYFEQLGEADGPLLGSAWVAIGPTTASALAALGHPATEVAEVPTPEALVEATVAAVRASRSA